MKDTLFNMMIESLREEIKKSKERQKSCLKTYLYASKESKPYGALPNFPRQDIIGEPVVNQYWYSSDIVPCASAFGIGSCMQCTYIPDALKDLVEGIEDWLRWT